MPANTPNLGLPYPVGTDPVDVNGDIQRLAQSIDAAEQRFVNIIGDTMTGPLAGVDVTLSNALRAVHGEFTDVAIIGTDTLALRVTSPGNQIRLNDAVGQVGMVSAAAGVFNLIMLGPGGLMRLQTDNATRLSISDTAVTIGAGVDLWLNREPTELLHAATKAYVDSRVVASGGISQPEADALYVNLVGDTMMGPLTLSGDPTAALHAAPKQYVDTNFMPKAGGAFTGVVAYPTGVAPTSPNHLTDKEYTDATFYPKAGNATITGYVVTNGYVLIDNQASQNQLYIEGVGPSQTIIFRDPASAQVGYISTNTAQYMRICADAGPIYLRCGTTDILLVEPTVVRSNKPAYIQGQTRIAGGIQGLVVTDPTGGYIGIYSGSDVDSVGTRRGYMGFSSTSTMRFTNETGTGGVVISTQPSGSQIDFYCGGVYAGRWAADGTLLVNKVALDTTTVGVALYTAGRVYTTTGSSTSYNFLSNIVAAVDNNVHMSMRRSDVTVGSIIMNGTTGVVYNTTSDGRFKHEIGPITDEEAMARVRAYRPVKYQWKLDQNQSASMSGAPGGKVEWGLIAQEAIEVNDVAVSSGKGEPYQIDFEMMSMDYGRITPDLLAAIQAMDRRLSALESAA